MSSESATTRLARLEEKMTTVVEEKTRTIDAVTDFRRIMADTSTIASTNTTRIRALEEDITEIKQMLRDLQGLCVTRDDFKRLEASVVERRAMSTTKFASLMLLMGTLGSALILAATSIIHST